MITTIYQYECTRCGHITEKPNDDGYGMYCPVEDCGCDVRYHGERPARWISVAMYETGRCYGGPEEGGWYYTAGDICPETVRCYEIGDLPQANLYESQLWGSARAMSEGDQRYEVRTYCEKIPPMGFPSVRPRYC